MIFNIAAVAIGLFWGSGKVPWRFLAAVFVLLSFFSIGKYAMRARYWRTDEGEAVAFSVSVADYPSFYAEWAQTSLDETLGNGSKEVISKATDEKTTIESHSLLDRVNNLQNLLFVIEAVETRHIPVLAGATYTLVPKLLIPRILWPDKPRTHEGQVMLNVHFGRQDLTSTFQTYVAWGLLAEAYGNFGPIAGCLILGLALGAGLAWIENFTARKLVISLEGLVAFVIFLSLANSFEMVASVLVTSIEQAILPIIIAVTPFVRRQVTQQTVHVDSPPPES